MKYDIEGQIKHKIEFIENYVPKHVKVTIIGYSLGAKIALRLLEHPEMSKKISRCYFLFPAIERLSKSFAGRNFPVIQMLLLMLRIFFLIFQMFPLSVKRFFIRLLLHIMFLDVDNLEDSFLQVTYPISLEKVIFLANDIYSNVQKRDDNLIEANLHKLKFYYGTSDQFVSKKFYYELVERFPQIDAELCKRNYSHSFFYRNSIEMAEMVCNWIKEKQ